MDDFQIKKAEIKDWPVLLNIFDKSLRSVAQYEPHLEEDYAKLYQCLMNHSFPLYDVYVYVVHDNIIGFICYYEHKIEMLYVLPEHMNKGIGTKLLQYILDNYKETLEIGVAKENPVSLHLYSKHGFVIAREEEYDVSGIYSPHYIMIREYSE